MQNKNKLPLVSIIIACRNEEEHIGKCLDSVAKNNYPINKIEIIIVDGMSTDDTIDVVKSYKSRFKTLQIINNLHKTTPYAVNIGLKRARGEYFFWISAHSTLAKNYLKISVETIQKYKVDSVGGLAIAKTTSESSLVQSAISYSLNSSFGSGNAAYRSLNINKIVSVDAVFGQCFDRKVIIRYGYLNEKLTRNQDYEYNQRIIRNGGTILLNPNLVTYYSPPETIYKFTRQAFSNGLWTVLSNKYMTFRSNKLRHYMPLIFVIVLMVLSVASIWLIVATWMLESILACNLAINIAFSLLIAWSSKKLGLIIIQPIIFIFLHLGYGLGSVYGLLAYSGIVRVK